MQARKPSDTVTLLERHVAAPRPAVFAALTQPRHLLGWLGMTDMALIACEVDLRSGGTFRYVFRRAGGSTIEVRGAYDLVDAPSQYAYTETYDFSPLTILVTTVLEEAADGTVMRQTMQYATQDERDDDFAGVVASSTEAFARLERYLAGGRP